MCLPSEPGLYIPKLYPVFLLSFAQHCKWQKAGQGLHAQIAMATYVEALKHSEVPREFVRWSFPRSVQKLGTDSLCFCTDLSQLSPISVAMAARSWTAPLLRGRRLASDPAVTCPVLPTQLWIVFMMSKPHLDLVRVNLKTCSLLM